MICSEDKLSLDDRWLESIYKDRLRLSEGAEAAGLQRAQRAWIAKRDECVERKIAPTGDVRTAAIACMKKAYVKRIKEIMIMRRSLDPRDGLSLARLINRARFEGNPRFNEQLGENPAAALGSGTLQANFIYCRNVDSNPNGLRCILSTADLKSYEVEGLEAKDLYNSLKQYGALSAQSEPRAWKVRCDIDFKEVRTGRSPHCSWDVDLGSSYLARPEDGKPSAQDVDPAIFSVLGVVLGRSTIQQIFIRNGRAPIQRSPTDGKESFCYIPADPADATTILFGHGTATDEFIMSVDGSEAAHRDVQCAIVAGLSKDVATASGLRLGMSKHDFVWALSGGAFHWAGNKEYDLEALHFAKPPKRSRSSLRVSTKIDANFKDNKLTLLRVERTNSQ